MKNDLWRYDVNNSMWSWMYGSYIRDKGEGVYGEKGIANYENYPSARIGTIIWYDSNIQELWLFGGYGYTQNGYGM